MTDIAGVTPTSFNSAARRLLGVVPDLWPPLLLSPVAGGGQSQGPTPGLNGVGSRQQVKPYTKQ